jgi:hypothetical protein
MKSLFVLLTFYVLSISCAFELIATLDDFSGSQNLLVITNNAFPASSSSFLNTSSVYGGQRDLELIVESGGASQIFTSSVANNTLSLSSPNSANGYTIYQLDGMDDSMNINENGLNNFDATFAGSATAFQITGAADIDTNLNITVYTSTGVGKYHLIIASSQSQDYFILYSSFTGNANFASVGAIEIFFDGSSGVDSTFSFFGIVSDSTEQPETSESTADVPQSSKTSVRPVSPVTPLSSRGKTPATVKGYSNVDTSDDSSATVVLPCAVIFVALVFAMF